MRKIKSGNREVYSQVSTLIIVLFFCSSAFALFQAPFEEGVRPVNLKTQNAKLKSSAQRSNVKSFFPKEVVEEGVEGAKDIKESKVQEANQPVQVIVNIISIVFLLVIIIAGLIMFWPKRK